MYISQGSTTTLIKSTTIYNNPLELVFVDIWGPAPIVVTNGARYYIAFIDAYSRYTWLYLLHARSQFVFINFKTYAETQTGFKLKSLQTDNAKEFLVLNKTFIFV